MELGGYGFEKSELLKTAEEIYSLKSKKQDLELALSSEKFHYKYIPKRRHLVRHEVTFRLIFIIPITIIVVGALGYMIPLLLNPNSFVGEAAEGDGLSFLFTMLVSVFGGYVAVRLWIREIRMLTLLRISMNPEKATEFAKKHDINTFQNDEELSRRKIDMFEEEIASIEQKLLHLEKHQAELIEQKKKEEDILREKGILFDENPNKKKSDSGFSLREESIGEQDVLQLHELYSKEEQYIRDYIMKLETDVQIVNKEIIKIDDDFEHVKKVLIFSGFAYILLILVQGAFTGVLYTLTSVLCLIGSLIYIFYLESKCKQPILLYLIEHDSELTTEYAFCNNIVPFYNKRNELLEMIEYQQKELADVKKMKEELVF